MEPRQVLELWRIATLEVTEMRVGEMSARVKVGLLLVGLGTTLAVGRMAAIAGEYGQEPPPLPFARADGTLDPKKIPEWVPVYGAGGRLVGYAMTRDVLFASLGEEPYRVDASSATSEASGTMSVGAPVIPIYARASVGAPIVGYVPVDGTEG